MSDLMSDLHQEQFYDEMEALSDDLYRIAEGRANVYTVWASVDRGDMVKVEPDYEAMTGVLLEYRPELAGEGFIDENREMVFEMWKAGCCVRDR